MRGRIEGLIAAPFTPMKEDGSLHLDQLKPYAEFLARNGVKGCFIAGTTGESLSLTVAERQEIAERWVRSAPEGFEVWVHVGDNCLANAKALAAHAQKVGASAIGAMAPCFFRPDQNSPLVAFLAEIAREAPDLPFYYYHIPSMTHVPLRMLDFLKEAGDRIPNFVGAKFTHEDLMEFCLCSQLEAGRFHMVLGYDELLLCGLAVGARAAIGSTYNFAAPLYSRIIQAFSAGHMDKAKRLQEISMEIVQALRASGPFLPANKAIMKMVGIDCGPPRLPFLPMRLEAQKSLEERLREIGFFEVCSR